MIVDKIINNKNKIQNFLDNLNCDDDKWFVFNCSTGVNPTVRKFSHRMSYRIMNNNTETFKCRFLYLKIKKDMIVTCENYDSIKVDDMDIENDKYDDVGDSFLRKGLFGELKHQEELILIEILGFIIKIIKISYSMTIYQMMLNLR